MDCLFYCRLSQSPVAVYDLEIEMLRRWAEREWGQDEEEEQEEVRGVGIIVARNALAHR